MKPVFSYLNIGAAKYTNTAHENALFILHKQLKDKGLWKKFISVFHAKADIADNGWRGEYFGKMMRGACLTYRYFPDEELYEIMYDTVKNLLATQDELGRITTYTVEAEYNGWDMWTRKYVLVGCLYFYGVCKDEAFKTQIIEALKKHVDYLLATLGEGKKSIVDTSHWWGGVNSCSILEPIVELYKITKEEKYLAFAEYILKVGGCKDGNLIEIAEADELYPYQYPEVKAYETMSFFEGALAYYETTGNERYLKIVQKFVDAVMKTDVTIIGCSGCTHELFDNSAIKQTEEIEGRAVMQETCVTVTWVRLLERLLRVTGEAKYAECIERSVWNALYGSINFFGNQQYSAELDTFLDGVPFDSYSPLVFKERGIGIGGFKQFAEGGYYGCCACIGAAGTGLFPLIGAMRSEDGFVFNYYNDGEMEEITPNGQKVKFTISGNYLATGNVKMKIALEKAESFVLCLRVPAWSNAPTIALCGDTVEAQVGYAMIDKEWQDGEEIVLAFHPEIKRVDLNGKSAFEYGAFALARDEQKESGDIKATFTPIMEKGKLVAKVCAPEKGEQVRFLLKTEEGEVLLTDYASCGKKWMEERNRISVWLNVK